MVHRFLGITLIGGLLGGVPTIDVPGFLKALQEETILSTVRIVNATKDRSGSGVILTPRSGAAVYILTAAHVVSGADAVDVHVFSSNSYPKPQRTYTATVIARRSSDNQDLALLCIAAFGGEAKGLKVCAMKDLPKKKPFAALAAGCVNGSEPTLRSISITGDHLAKRPGEGKAARFWSTPQEPN